MSPSDAPAAGERAIPRLDRLALLSRDRRLEFAFAVGTMPFHVHLRTSEEGARMLIAGDIGTLPYTAESADSRNSLARILQHCENFEWGGIKVTPSNRIVVHGEVPLQPPINPFSVVRDVSRFIVTIYPVISLVLDEALGRRPCPPPAS